MDIDSGKKIKQAPETGHVSNNSKVYLVLKWTERYQKILFKRDNKIGKSLIVDAI